MTFLDDAWNFGSNKKKVGQPGQPTGAQLTAQAGKNMIGGLQYVPVMVGGIGYAGTAWNALGTTGKVVLGAGAGLLAGGFLFGSKKQEQSQAFGPQNPVQNTNTKTISNQITNTYQITNAQSYMIQSNSPYSSMKKADNIGGQAGPVSPSLTPQVSVVPQNSASQSGQQGQGTDWATLAAIAGVALVAYGYTSRKGAK